MLSLLPDFADPARLCALGKAYEGAIPLADLSRLAPLLTSTEGEAAFALAFRMDAEGRPVVQVKVRASLPVQCQRCLDTMMHEVDSTSRLVVVSGPEEAERLPDDLDPLLVGNDRVALRSLLEDELLLAIPAAPRHRTEDCKVKLDELNALPEQRAASVDRNAEHPFAALANWKSDKENQD
jgi:uncharacterized protein